MGEVLESLKKRVGLGLIVASGLGCLEVSGNDLGAGASSGLVLGKFEGLSGGCGRELITLCARSGGFGNCADLSHVSNWQSIAESRQKQMLWPRSSLGRLLPKKGRLFITIKTR